MQISKYPQSYFISPDRLVRAFPAFGGAHRPAGAGEVWNLKELRHSDTRQSQRHEGVATPLGPLGTMKDDSRRMTCTARREE